VKLFILISRLLKAAAESADGAFSVSSVSVTHAIFLLSRIIEMVNSSAFYMQI